MKTQIKTLFFTFLLTTVFFSCQKDDVTSTEGTEESRTEISSEIIAKLNELNFNTSDGIKINDIELLDGTLQKYYTVEGDINFTETQMDELLRSDSSSKQYVSNLRVNAPQTITVYAVYGNSQYSLSYQHAVAVSRAVQSYNSLGLTLRFNFQYGTNWGNSDIIVYGNPNTHPTAHGQADFPSNGNPGRLVTVFRNAPTNNQGVADGLILHEIGHAIGFRHSDWFSRQSCGGTSEGVFNGANHIPGTPTGFDPSSVFNSCYSSNSFNQNDRTALQYVY